MSNFAVAQGIIVLIGILVYALFFRRKSDELLPLPPGPKPLPILGNILDGPPAGVPEFKHWLPYKDKYGPISSVTFLGKTMILIHDREAAAELLEKFANKTASRPQMNFLSLCGYDRWLSVMPYNRRHRLYRKLIHQQIGTKALSEQFIETQDIESKRFLLRILIDPDNLFRHIKTETSAAILKFTYGYSTELYKPDPLVALEQHVLEGASAVMVPFHWAVDIFPFLAYLPEWFPGAGFKKIAREWRTSLDATAEIPFNFTRSQMRLGVHQNSYASKLIESFEKDGREMDEETIEAIQWTASMLFAGGAETTVASIKAFAMAMLMNPDIQQKAQEEIDRVVGTHRLPDMSDEENLPYVRGVIKEAFRLYPILPVSIAHEMSEEMVFRGYRLPKGSFACTGTWWFFNDPKTYANPSKFDPERYMAPRNEPEPVESFGYGRRICPGRHIADQTLFYTISRLLATFTISKAMHNGKPVDVVPEHKPGGLDHPQDFPYSIAPRNERCAELIRRVEVDFPWEGSSSDCIQGNAIFDEFKAKCAAGGFH